eukprot:6208203-Pyramimonas_sp.AAC.1
MWLIPIGWQPSLLILAEEVARVQLGRANGSSSTFDLTIDMRDGAVHEFAMLPREELGRLNEYLAN